MGLLDGKVAFIFGVANHRSIAWGIAKQLHEHGATIALSIFNEDMRRRVEPLAEEIGCDFIEPCDVNNDEEIDAVMDGNICRCGCYVRIKDAILNVSAQKLAYNAIDEVKA